MAARTGRALAPGLLLGGVSLVAYLFLYAPIAVLVALSFNTSRLSASWGGFTLDWHVKAATNPLVLASLRNSLVVAFATTVVATADATAAALAFHRDRFRRQGLLEGLIVVPTVAPEIVLAASMLLLFAAAGLRLGLLTIVLAHVGDGRGQACAWQGGAVGDGFLSTSSARNIGTLRSGSICGPDFISSLKVLLCPFDYFLTIMRY